MAIHKRTTAKGTTRWAVTWNEAGKRREKWFTHKREAVQFDADVKLRKARRLPIFNDKITFRELARNTWNSHYRLKSQRYQQGARSQLTNHIVPWFGEYRACDLDAETIASTMHDMRAAGVNPPTLNEVHKHLSVIFNRGVAWGHIAVNPMMQVDRFPTDDRLIEVYTPDQVYALANAAGQRHHRDYALIIATAFSGMRISEAFALRWDDVRETAIRVERSLDEDRSIRPTKAYQQRTVPVADNALIALAEWREHAPPTEWVFPNASGAPIHESNFNRRNWQPAREAAGLTAARFHELRHTFASMAINEGISIVRLSKWMGHAKTSITMDTYGHLYDVDGDEAARQALSARMAGHVVGRATHQ